jgi:hypothetical protein
LRRGRFARFWASIPSIQLGPAVPPIRILDIGGTESFWAGVWNDNCQHLSIVLLNVREERVSRELPIVSAVGDARDLSIFRDCEFDYCFSNSVIEHVGSLDDQKRMADEARRVGRGYFIQTPYRYFPIESHFHVPAWNQMPLWLRTALHQNLDLGWISKQRSYLMARADVERIRLVSIREMRLLFPDGEILFERIGPCIKSLIAMRVAPPSGR